MSRDTTHYGQYYWCIGLVAGTEIFLDADRAETQPSGTLVMWQDTRRTGEGYNREPLDQPRINLAFAAGQWIFVYAASCLDGHAVAVQHWKGQIAE